MIEIFERPGLFQEISFLFRVAFKNFFLQIYDGMSDEDGRNAERSIEEAEDLDKSIDSIQSNNSTFNPGFSSSPTKKNTELGEDISSDDANDSQTYDRTQCENCEIMERNNQRLLQKNKSLVKSLTNLKKSLQNKSEGKTIINRLVCMK